MIAKHIKKNAAVKGNYGALIDYLTNNQGNSERVGEVSVTNCGSDDVEASKLEVLAIQKFNTRAKADKTYHLLLSFDKGEKPTAEQLKMIEDEFCNALGFKGHQRISVVHEDTDNLHVHVAINKINPSTYRVVDPVRDYRILGRKASEVEKNYGLNETNHGRNVKSHQAQDFEAQTGLESFVTYMRKLALEIDKVQSWKELHATLAQAGVTCNKKGNGLAFTSNDVTVKASSVSRAFTLKKLEERLGKFEPSKESIQGKGYNKDKPLRQDTQALQDYASYKKGTSTNVKGEIKSILAEQSLFTQVMLSQELDPQIRQLLLLLASMSTDDSIKKTIKKAKADQSKSRTFKGFLQVKARAKQEHAEPGIVVKIAHKMHELHYGKKIYDFINAQLKLLHLKSLTRPAQTVVRERLCRLQKRAVEGRQRKSSRIL